MAVVKKYQLGGVSPNPGESLQDFLVNKLSETKFTTSGERLARNAADRFLKLYNTGKFNEVYSYDPIQQTYSIDRSKIEDESLKNLEWGGSKDAIHQNVFGQFSGTPDKSNKGEVNAEDKKYNTLIASWVNEYNSRRQVSDKKIGLEKDIPELFNYMTNNLYGGKEEILNQDFGRLSEDEKKAKMLSSAKANVEQYLADWNKNKETDSFKNVDKVLSLKSAIESGDWNKFKEASYTLGWNPDMALLSPEELKQRKDAEELKNKETEAQNSIDLYKKLGITNPNIQEFLFSKGYTEEDQSFVPEKLQGTDWFTDYMKAQNAIILKNPEGKHIIIRNNAIFDSSVQDPFHTGYGYSWNNADEGFKLFTPERTKQLGLMGEDKFAKENIGRELNAKIPGFEGWTVTGWSGEKEGAFVPDIMGRRDFTNHLILKRGNEKVELEKRDGKYYYKGTDKLFESQVSIYGYNPKYYTRSDYTYVLQNPNNVFKKFILSPAYNSDSEFEKSISNQGEFKTTTDDKGDIALIFNPSGDYDPKELSKLGAQLAYIIAKGDTSKKDQAVRRFEALNNFFISNGIIPIDPYNGKISKETSNLVAPPWLHRKGGVLKAQNGSALEAYKRRNPVVKQNVTTKKGFTPKSIAGTLQQATPEQVISLIGTGISFLPGVGAVGGAVTTIADIVGDVRKDGFQASDIFNWNTAANLGFTALSFFGLGGLKSVQVAAKAALKGEKAFNIAKAASKAEKLVEAAKASKSVEVIVSAEKLANSTKVIEKIANRVGSSEEAIKFVNRIGKTPAGKLAKEDIKILSDLGYKSVASNQGALNALNTSLSRHLEQTIKLEASPSNKIQRIVKLLPKLEGVGSKARKFAKKAVITGTVAANVPSVMNLAENIKERGVKEGLKITQLSDLKGTLALTSLGTNWLKGRQAVKAVKNQASLGKEGEDKFKLLIGKDKSIDLTGKVVLPKPTRGIKSPLKKTIKTEDIDKLKSDLTAAGVADDQLENIVKQVQEGKVSVSMDLAKPLGYQLPKQPKLSSEDPLKSLKEYEKAKKVLERRLTSYGWGNWFKEGGVLKYQVPFGPLVFNPEYYTRLSKNIPEITTKMPAKVFDKTPVNLKEIALKGFNQKPTLAKQDTSRSYSTDVKTNKFDLKNLTKGIDKTDISNLAMYFNTMAANKKSTAAQKRAVMAGVVNLPTMQKQYFRMTTPYARFYEGQARQLEGQGKRLASTISDVDKYIATRLSAANQANELRTKGMQEDQVRLDQMRGAQSQADLEAARYNAEIAAKNKMMAAEAEKSVHLLDSNKTAADATALNNLITAFNHNLKIKDQEKRGQRLYELASNPKMKKAYDYYSSLASEEGQAPYKKQWESAMNVPNVVKTEWLQSPQYKNWVEAVKLAAKGVEPYTKLIEQSQLAASYGVPVNKWPKFKSGGSTSEWRIQAAKIRAKSLKEIQEEKLMYSTILENNKLMHQSLIKVFK